MSFVTIDLSFSYVTCYIITKTLHNVLCNICYNWLDYVLYNILYNLLYGYRQNVFAKFWLKRIYCITVICSFILIDQFKNYLISKQINTGQSCSTADHRWNADVLCPLLSCPLEWNHHYIVRFIIAHIFSILQKLTL